MDFSAKERTVPEVPIQRNKGRRERKSADASERRGGEQPERVAPRDQPAGEPARQAGAEARSAEQARLPARPVRSSTLMNWDPREFWTASPFELMRRFSDEMDRTFRGMAWPGSRAVDDWGWSPSVEILERKGRFIVRAELPGVSADELKVKLLDDDLVIEGERKREEEREEEGFYRSERSYGRFHRRIPLPAGVKSDDVRADFRNGVLEVSLGLPEHKRREIPIQTAKA
jgi:HSP20 family protein